MKSANMVFQTAAQRFLRPASLHPDHPAALAAPVSYAEHHSRSPGSQNIVSLPCIMHPNSACESSYLLPRRHTPRTRSLHVAAQMRTFTIQACRRHVGLGPTRMPVRLRWCCTRECRRLRLSTRELSADKFGLPTGIGWIGVWLWKSIALAGCFGRGGRLLLLLSMKSIRHPNLSLCDRALRKVRRRTGDHESTAGLATNVSALRWFRVSSSVSISCLVVFQLVPG